MKFCCGAVIHNYEILQLSSLHHNKPCSMMLAMAWVRHSVRCVCARVRRFNCLFIHMIIHQQINLGLGPSDLSKRLFLDILCAAWFLQTKGQRSKANVTGSKSINISYCPSALLAWMGLHLQMSAISVCWSAKVDINQDLKVRS